MNKCGLFLLLIASSFVALLGYLWCKVLENAPIPSEGVKYYVVNSSTEHRRHLLEKDNVDLAVLNFQSNSTLFIIIHGYTESSFRDWIELLIPALLNAEPTSTVLIVDHWNLLCFSRPIMNDNIHSIARGVAGLLNTWTSSTPLRLKNVHVIGFSLGGRIAGVVPHYLEDKSRIGRITGVDPSFPWTKTQNTSEFLDSGDADLVVTIRTSSVGVENPPVHIDFYVNNGTVQPECKKWYRLNFIEQICSHYKAPMLFVSALLEKKESFSACKCRGEIRPPNPEDCSCSTTNSFGLNTDAKSLGIFYTEK